MRRYHGYSKIDPMAAVQLYVAHDESEGLRWLRYATWVAYVFVYVYV